MHVSLSIDFLPNVKLESVHELMCIYKICCMDTNLYL